MTTLIAADNFWLLFALIFCVVAVAIYLEQTYKWAVKLTGPLICILLALVLANIRVAPTSSAVYNTISNYFIPFSVSMFLFKANLKKIFRASGRMFLIYNITAVGTAVLGVTLMWLMKDIMPEPALVAPISVGGAIGGGVNNVAISASLNVPGELFSAYMVAVNLVTVPVYMFHSMMPGFDFLKKHFPHPYEDELEKIGSSTEAKTKAAAFWGAKDMSLLDMAKTIAVSFTLAAVSAKIAAFLSALLAAPDGGTLAQIPAMVLGNQYVILTVVTVCLVTIFPDFFENLRGSQEMGTFLIYCFFVTLGFPGNFAAMAGNAVLCFIFAFILFILCIIFALIVGKICKGSIEEIALASNACIGGPTTAAAIAVGRGYSTLVTPALLVGLWGYIIGTPVGIAVHTILVGIT